MLEAGVVLPLASPRGEEEEGWGGVVKQRISWSAAANNLPFVPSKLPLVSCVCVCVCVCVCESTTLNIRVAKGTVKHAQSAARAHASVPSE